MRLSILVVSRTASLVNRLCESINRACSLSAFDVEILCSWNGSTEEEQCIENKSRYDFHIAQRMPYHFAGNMNELASLAGGDVLMLANDDLILDESCVDKALAVLASKPNVGLVGGRLRNQAGQLTHAGIQFDSRYSPYHSLDGLIPSNQTELTPEGPVAAVTGALQWIRRDDFLQHPFNPKYRICGEDVELCLDVQQSLNQQVWLCNEASAIHESETTRSQQENQHQGSDDLLRLRARTQTFIAQASAEQLRILLMQYQRESQQLRTLVQNDLSDLEIQLLQRNQQQMEKEQEQELVLTDLREERLQLMQELERLKGGQ